MAIRLNRTPMALVPRRGLRADLELLADTVYSAEDGELHFTSDGKNLFVITNAVAGNEEVIPIQSLDMAVCVDNEVVCVDNEIVYVF